MAGSVEGVLAGVKLAPSWAVNLRGDFIGSAFGKIKPVASLRGCPHEIAFRIKANT
jgi:hypothetical protein